MHFRSEMLSYQSSTWPAENTTTYNGEPQAPVGYTENVYEHQSSFFPSTYPNAHRDKLNAKSGAFKDSSVELSMLFGAECHFSPYSYMVSCIRGVFCSC
jgi:hypothetical protein